MSWDDDNNALAQELVDTDTGFGTTAILSLERREGDRDAGDVEWDDGTLGDPASLQQSTLAGLKMQLVRAPAQLGSAGAGPRHEREIVVACAVADLIAAGADWWPILPHTHYLVLTEGSVQSEFEVVGVRPYANSSMVEITASGEHQ